MVEKQFDQLAQKALKLVSAHNQAPKHGLLHVSRVSLFCAIVSNYFKAFNPELVAEFTQQELRLVQLTALLHDAGREADGHDIWEKESADVVHNFLSSNGFMDQANFYASLVVEKDDVRNPHAMVLHDADLMDVMRSQATDIRIHETFMYKAVDQNDHSIHILLKLFEEVRNLLIDQHEYGLKAPHTLVLRHGQQVFRLPHLAPNRTGDNNSTYAISTVLKELQTEMERYDTLRHYLGSNHVFK